MVDLNNPEYLKALADAANSKDGQIIVEFLRSESEGLSYEDINNSLPFDQIGLEYKVINKVKSLFKKCLNYLM